MYAPDTENTWGAEEFNLGVTTNYCGNCGCPHYVALDGTVMCCINTDITDAEVYARIHIQMRHDEMGLSDSCECYGKDYIHVPDDDNEQEPNRVPRTTD